ncbi:MAG: ribonuclease III [Proteobacteria bacterium]|nr:ribonuclease III [Pseudomonadota bacterium]
MSQKPPDHVRPSLHSLEELLGHQFKNPDILQQALTHSSASKDRAQSNERLEFLGDRVLGLVCAGMLLDAFPDESEGELGYRFSGLARAESLARVGAAINLAPLIVLSEGEEATGRDNPAILADCCEAVIAALFLDGGLEKAKAFIQQHWRPLMAENPLPPKDPKTMLQEWAQGHGLPLPKYEVTAQEGPTHAPTFTVRVTVHEKKPTSGEGSSKQAAEQAAAENMLNSMGAGK